MTIVNARQKMQVRIQSVGEKDCAACGIRDQSLFRDLNAEDFRLIDQPIHDMTVEAHMTLFDEGSPGVNLYTIRSGLVKLVRYQPDGSQRIIRLLTAGDIAGLESTAVANYDSTAITVTPVHACRIPQAVIKRLEAESPRLHAQLLRKWHEALKQADDFIADLASGSARQRLARLLLRLSQHDSTRQVLLPSREDVGAMLGITTETASRAVAVFRREGLLVNLDRQGRHFRVDAERLEAIGKGGAPE
jgi:CRP/FNR family transcriptional regulator